MELVEKPKQWWGSTIAFWRETKSELKKVSWPSRPEVIGTTATVLVATIFFGVYLWICDLAFYKMIDFIFTRFGGSVAS
jgi:preprotein translocase subunit SecE